MKRMWLIGPATAAVLFLVTTATQAWAGSDLPKGVRDLEVGALWYLSYQNGESASVDYNDFKMKRGYINVTKRMTPWLEARITPDVHQDEAGDMKVRLKYAYAKFLPSSRGAVFKPWLEFGQVHTPWLDFEEHVNYYRLQDTMFSERNGNFNSADFGVTFGALLGGEMGEEYQRSVNSKYPGRYGSFAVGVYNGGGYHAAEMNENKALEGRLTIRPSPDVVPGLQVSYFGIYGDENLPEDTAVKRDWRFNLGMVSYEHERVTLTGTYAAATGKQGGNFVIDAEGRRTPVDAVESEGFSFFGELKMPEHKSSVIARWDHYEPNSDLTDNENDRMIVGYAYHLPMGSMVLVDFERLSYEDDAADDDWRFQTTVQVHYP